METQIVLELPSGPGNPRNSEGSFFATGDNQLHYLYTRYNGTGCEDHAAADLVMRTSADNGKTWDSADRVVVRNDAMNVMSVSVLRLQDGRLALVYVRKQAATDFFCDCRPVIRFSTDEAKTWSDPQYCIHIPGYFVVNNDRLVQLSTGRLLLPTALHRYRDDGTLDSRGIVFFYYSDDAGATWREAPEWILPPQSAQTGLQEPGVVELSDGRLMAWMRTDQGCQYKAFSVDGGLHWSSAIPAPEFPSSTSPLSLKRHSGNRMLYAVWNDYSPYWRQQRLDSSWGRTPLVMACSSTDGATWHSQLKLEDDPACGYCYIAMYFTADALLLGYCCGGQGTEVLQDSRLRRISLVLHN